MDHEREIDVLTEEVDRLTEKLRLVREQTYRRESAGNAAQVEFSRASARPETKCANAYKAGLKHGWYEGRRQYAAQIRAVLDGPEDA